MSNTDIYFSIIIPTYNRVIFLKVAIESVLTQEYKNFELLLIDDGSTDTTEEYVRSLNDVRVKYFKKENQERAIARNFGIKKATGDYITFLDSDDMLFPNHLMEAVKLINDKHPEWFHLAYQVKNYKRVLWKTTDREGDLNEKLLTGNHLSCIGVFIRNDILLQFQFNENPLLIGSEDYELWLRLASRYPLFYSNNITSQINQHRQRSVLNFDPLVLQNRTDYLIKIIRKDKTVRVFIGDGWNKFVSYRNIYLALHFAIAGYYIKSLNYIFYALKKYPKIIFSRSFYGACKSLIRVNISA